MTIEVSKRLEEQAKQQFPKMHAFFDELEAADIPPEQRTQVLWFLACVLRNDVAKREREVVAAIAERRARGETITNVEAYLEKALSISDEPESGADRKRGGGRSEEMTPSPQPRRHFCVNVRRILG